MGWKGKKKNEEEEDEFSLEDVLDLGGTENDYEMLKDIENSKHGKSDVNDSLKDEEFKKFFMSLGFDQIDPNEEEREDVNSGNVIESEDDNEPKQKESMVEKKQQCPLQDDQITSTTTQVVTAKQARNQVHPVRELSKEFVKVVELASILPKKMICKIGGPWYENQVCRERASNQEPIVARAVIDQLKALGEKLLQTEAELYKNRKRKTESGEDAWIKTVVTSGTLSDRVAAYTLMLQDAPIHNHWCLEAFLNMLKKKGKREAIIGLDALRDVFLSELLPDSRKLCSFQNQPFGDLQSIFQQDGGGATSKRTEIQRHLILWVYEDRIKSSYQQLVVSLRDFFLQDSLEAIKTKGMKAVFELLTSKPEQERELLSMLVNKLGDPKYKIASKSLHMLSCLIRDHPLMQGIVVKAVRDLLLRPNVQPKCQYYCICFLSAQILSHERKEVADSLIQIYLGFFKAAIKKKQVDDKLLSAILTGVNRAYPYANTEDMKIIEELDVLFRTVHVSGFGTSVQALMLLFQILSSRNELSDRYFNALYSALMHPELPICTNRHPMFLNLVFRSLKADTSESRVKAFLKRLLQTCSLQLASYSSAVLILVMETVRARPSLRYFFQENRFIIGKTVASVSDVGRKFEDDSDEEHFVDADKEEGALKEADAVTGDNKKGSSWTHLHKKSLRHNLTTYDPMCRNPSFSNSECSTLWEMHRMICHFHPSVSRFAMDLSVLGKNGDPDRYPGDPLQDFSMMRFLDKFVYRNPKAKQEKDIGANIGQAPFRRKQKITLADTHATSANTPEFLRKKNHNPEELFLKRYFMSRVSGTLRPTDSGKLSNNEDDDIECVSDDEFDQFLATTEGQAALDDKNFDFADGAVGKGKKRKQELVQESDEEDLNSDDEEDFDLDEGEAGESKTVEEDPFDEDGMYFDGLDEMDGDESVEPPPIKRISKPRTSKKRKASADVETFGMMLEENTQNGFNASGSSAVRNRDRSSTKQLQWERKKEMKEIIAKKRSLKRNNRASVMKRRPDGKKNRWRDGKGGKNSRKLHSQ